jgi:hypothetical protein
MTKNAPAPRITSFVIRFVHDEAVPPGEVESWRGAIRHVQTEQEATFTHWKEALAFMEQFLPQHMLEEPKRP